MIGFEKDLIDETLAKQIEQIKNCRISLDKKGKKYFKISKKNSEIILKFLDECLARGLSKNRMMFYICRFRKLLKMVEKDFDKMNKEDIKNLVRKIESSNYKCYTKECYKIAIKKLFQFIKGFEWDSKQYPEEVRWIKVNSSKNNNKLPEEILTFEEIQEMVKNASNLRDKAFIYVLYESGARISEIMGLKIKHITFDKDGAIIMVNGKTGSRRIRLVLSASKLANWIENHPNKSNKESYVWTNLEKDDGKPLCYRRISDILKEVAKKAGIKKPVNPHAFRHARATHLAKHLPDAVMKSYFGWVQSSKMASIYYHLSGADIDSAILKIYGKSQEEKKKPLLPKICPRCEHENSPESEFCSKCGLPLGTEHIELKREKEMIEEISKLKKELENIKITEKKLLSLITPKMIEELIERKVQELLKNVG
jgi:site-specific recombinase XerD/ribosomal protein L40E